mgnify:CR=1 FL=1
MNKETTAFMDESMREWDLAWTELPNTENYMYMISKRIWNKPYHIFKNIDTRENTRVPTSRKFECFMNGLLSNREV